MRTFRLTSCVVVCLLLVASLAAWGADGGTAQAGTKLVPAVSASGPGPDSIAASSKQLALEKFLSTLTSPLDFPSVLPCVSDPPCPYKAGCCYHPLTDCCYAPSNPSCNFC
jgi:hypothetical protein